MRLKAVTNYQPLITLQMMANSGRKAPLGFVHSPQRFESAASLTRSKSVAPQLYQKLKQQIFFVLYVDKNCPLHGSRGKCTCASFVNGNNDGVEKDGMGSSESLHRSGDFGQQYHEINGSNDDLIPPSVKPFNNNPPLPNTQRDIIGNNLHFNAPSQNNNWIENENDQLAALLLYRDALKRNLTTPARAGGGLPKMRHGRIGSQWRHIKQTNTYSGSNLMFIDGTVRVDDSFKYPIPRFGYPPIRRPQHSFSSSYNDLSSNPTTQSLDTLTWSGADTLNRRPSLTQNSNRYQRPGKDNFPYWPIDSTYKKPQYKQPVQKRIKNGLD